MKRSTLKECLFCWPVIRKYHEDNTYYGAVGTVTTACVAYNTLKAYKLQNGLD